MTKRTVHQVPLILKPVLWIYGVVFGSLFWLQLKFFHWFCRIEYSGKEHIENCPNHILSIWHQNTALFFIAHLRFTKPNICLTYPLVYMKPIHQFKKWVGFRELAYGASGVDGKAAMNEVIERLKEGWSTFLNPDGPQGPLKQVRNGVLIMSLKSNTPVIPLSFQLSREWRLPSWDRKRYPFPFTRLVVIYGEPVWVQADTMEQSRARIAELMNDPEEPVRGRTGQPEV
jgi:lysophospholipid acyltransferase (LPLAT)-like uncharacterized protein